MSKFLLVNCGLITKFELFHPRQIPSVTTSVGILKITLMLRHKVTFHLLKETKGLGS